MAFDPYTNREIMELLKQQLQTDELTQEMLKNYYKLPHFECRSVKYVIILKFLKTPFTVIFKVQTTVNGLN